MIHVLLVDEQRLFSEAVRSLLATEEDIEQVAIATSGQEAIEYIREHEPDVVLMDIHVPQVNGIKATVHIKDNFPATKIIFLTSFAEKDLVIAGIIAGADGFLLKDIDARSLMQAIRNAYQGEVVISGEAARILATKIVNLKYTRKDILKEKLLNRNIHLSAREADVAILLSEEQPNKEMAETLQLSEGTVKNYNSDIYRKLQVKTRREAIAYLQGLFSEFDQ